MQQTKPRPWCKRTLPTELTVSALWPITFQIPLLRREPRSLSCGCDLGWDAVICVIEGADSLTHSGRTAVVCLLWHDDRASSSLQRRHLSPGTVTDLNIVLPASKNNNQSWTVEKRHDDSAITVKTTAFFRMQSAFKTHKRGRKSLGV